MRPHQGLEHIARGVGVRDLGRQGLQGDPTAVDALRRRPVRLRRNKADGAQAAKAVHRLAEQGIDGRIAQEGQKSLPIAEHLRRPNLQAGCVERGDGNGGQAMGGEVAAQGDLVLHQAEPVVAIVDEVAEFEVAALADERVERPLDEGVVEQAKADEVGKGQFARAERGLGEAPHRRQGRRAGLREDLRQGGGSQGRRGGLACVEHGRRGIEHGHDESRINCPKPRLTFAPKV